MNSFKFKTPFATSVFNNKYNHDACNTWPNLARVLVNDVTGDRSLCNKPTTSPLMSQADQDQLAKYITDMKFMPAGRYLYYSGRPVSFYNNCFQGDTQVLTRGGYRKLKEIVGEEHEVYSPIEKDFLPATIYAHGIQPLQKIIFKQYLGTGKKYEVIATRNHHWPLQNPLHKPQDTYDLRVGDVVNACGVAPKEDGFGYIHGLIFGDGTKEATDKNGIDTYKIRFCGLKDTIHLPHFIACCQATGTSYTISNHESYKGDTVVRIKCRDIDLKHVPKISAAEYCCGFINGWIHADGHQGKMKLLASVNKEALDWFVDNAASAGIVITGPIRTQVRDTRYKKNHSIHVVNFQYGYSFRGFRVESIEPYGEEEVFCPYEPKHQRIVIDHNIDTFNCFCLRAEEDTREEWGNIVKRASDCLMSGGGIGVDYSKLRPSGQTLSRTGGISSGPLPLMSSVNEIGRNVMQGGSRRSAIYASLNWQHEDIEAFLHAKDWSDTIKKLKAEDFNFPAAFDMTNMSINWDTAFMEKLEYIPHNICPTYDTRSVPDLWYKSIRKMCETGEPGHSYNFWENENDTLRNACVPYDTLILTSTGYQAIGDCVGKQVLVWNGEVWSTVTPKYTGEKELVKVTLTDGSSLVCSLNHEFITEGDKRVEADNLIAGMNLEKFDMPIVKEGFDFGIDAYSQGFYSGDGTKNQRWSYVYQQKEEALPRLKGNIAEVYYNNGDGYKYRWYHGVMYDKSFVPIEGSINYCLNWLGGLLDADGTVLSYKNGESLQIASIDKTFLSKVQLMLTRLGCRAKLTKAKEAGVSVLPDGKGGEKGYATQELWRLLIGCWDTWKLLGNGLVCNRLKFKYTEPQRDARRFIKVQSVEDAGYDSVFCFNEPIAHRGTFNGIVTGQCTEFTSEDDSDVCNLGSINFGNIGTLDELRSVVNLASKFLVCGSIRGDLPYEKVELVREQNRKIGLGLMGVHEWLLQRSLPYEVNDELKSWLQVWKDESERAANEWSDRFFINRPKKYRAVAPAGTIGILASTTGGIEPLFAVAYKRRYLEGGTKWKYQYVVDSTAQHLVDTYGINPDEIETSSSLAADPERRIRFQYEIQKYVDMAISSTINLPEWGSELNNESTSTKLADTLLRYCHGLRGITVYPNGSRGGQPLTSVSYEEAKKHHGIVYAEENACSGGICSI